MKSLFKAAILVGSAGFFASCNSSDTSLNSSIGLKMSASTPTGSTVINSGRVSTSGRAEVNTPITIADVKVNVRDIKFEFDREDHHFKEAHFKKDSCFNDGDDVRLKGPFLIDLMNAGTFVDQILTSVTVPKGTYRKVRFKLSPSQVDGNMKGKSIQIDGKIDAATFVFWHNRDAGFGAKFADSTLQTSTAVANVAIKLELDKIFNALNGGIDLTKAVDGNKDGVISIDPTDVDGNKWLADQIMMLLVRHAHCEKKDH